MSSPEPGSHRRLGASWDGSGVNLALWAPSAIAVEACLYDDSDRERRVALPSRTEQVWHGYLPGTPPGQRYGFRLHGPHCDPAKLLLDPYALAVDGDFTPHGSVLGPAPAGGVDSAPYVPRAVVVDRGFDWSGDAAPDVPWTDTVIYELHVRGFTMRHPGIPAALRGTYAGLAHPAALEHLTGLGVTSVELLPVHQSLTEPALSRRGLGNFWGYNTIGFLAPHGGYSSAGTRGEQVREFKQLVRALHAAGLEVILDVVYNHTAEGDETGPTLCLRGIDAPAYYRQDPADPARYDDVTGCGNTLDASRSPGLRLVMDSLRYWVEDMHVDGFRFDLAPALARSASGVDLGGPFLAAVGQDPVLGRVKLIAEPWDVGSGGYQVGRFPPQWSEWNDRYRDCVRDFWRGRPGGVRELGDRLSGSSDLYRGGGRGPRASVNYVTAHDGFTLRDLVSYDGKHNEGNGEGNRDGESTNRSWNCGAEGPAPADIEQLRRRQSRNFLATLLLSAGVPMLLAGDELRRTQLGNNNAYCQDNELSYVDWTGASATSDGSLLRWTAELVKLRAAEPAFRRTEFLDGRPLPGGGGGRELAWFDAGGAEMTEAHWHDPVRQTVGMYVDGRTAGRPASAPGAGYLLWLHAGAEPVTVVLPPWAWGRRYDVLLDTTTEEPVPGRRGLGPGAVLTLTGRSVTLLRCHHHYSAGRSGEQADPGRSCEPRIV